ncbi:phage tail tape measure protein [Chitinophaga tropicalis]|uniref:Phage tail tape measure protein domain-containing protein n=1 Tax=Chitinophaga tropicalis TaxID=2683588 RepID=A0A7K1UAH8_9BACT|nr:phage tail tape measure protein [Chitinophaga tropicalis]MVT11377.1 hypothetical protein [Chitinophaga tropicalis]
MATTFGKVTKIYDLRTLGYDRLIKEQTTVTANWEKASRAKRELNKVAAETARAQGVESEAYKKTIQQLAELKVKEAELRVERQKLINEQKAQQAQRQSEITQREKGKQAIENEKLAQQQLRTERERAAAQLKQEQLTRQQEINQRNKEKQSVDAAAGSYNSLNRQYRELYNLVKSAGPGSNINFRGQTLNYDQAISKLKQLAAAEQDFRRQFQRDGLLVGEYTSGIVQAFKRMGLGDLVGAQVTQAQQRLQQLNTTFNGLKQQLEQVRATGKGSLEQIERLLLENRREAIALQEQIRGVRSSLLGFGDIGNQITKGIAQGFKDMRTQLAQFVVGYLGFQAILSGTQKLIHQNYELSDSIAQIKIYTKGTTEDVRDLVDELKKLDTRTSLRGLTDIAAIVAKKGVARDEIVGVTQALDQLFVVLGKEVGDPHEAVQSMVKLVNVYSHDQHVTAKNISDIGAAIAKLTSSGVATGRFLIDFSERMAGIRGITGLTIDKVLGLGAALQELGQRSEVSATALSQLIVKLFTNAEKYAAIVGKSTAEFNKMLRDSPIDTFVLVAERLKGNAGEMEKFFEGVTDLHVRGGRIIGVLGDIAGNAEYARKRLKAATEALGDQAALAYAFGEKNKTFAATLDQIGKKFELLGANRSVQILLAAIAGLIITLLSNIPTLLLLTGLWTTGWALMNRELFLARANLLLVNAQLLAGRLALGAITIVTNFYTVALTLLTGTYRGLTIAATAFSRVLLATPIGWILAGVGLLAGAMAAFAGTVSGTTGKIVDHAMKMKLMGEIQEKVQQQTGATINKIALLRSVMADSNISMSSRKKALEDLIALNPEYLKGLTLENAVTAEGKNLLDGYIASLREKAELQAGEAIANKAIEERTRLEKTLFDLELKRKQGKTGKYELSDEEQKFLSRGRQLPFGAAIGAVFGKSSVDNAIDNVKDAISAATAQVDQANVFLKSKYDQIGKTTKKEDGTKSGPPKRTPSYLEGLIDDLNKQLKVTEIGTEAAKQLKEERDKLQKEYDDATKKDTDKTYSGAKLSGEQRDVLKEADAARDQLLADEQLRFAKGEIDEATHLQNILKINQDAIDKKISLLKGANAEEKKVISDLKLDRITQERETNEKLFKLEEDRLKNHLENVKKNAEQDAKAVADNPVATETEKAQAKLDADKTILSAQEAYNAAMDTLEKRFSVNSKKNAEERATAVKQINADVNKDLLVASKATIADLKKQGEAAVAAYKATIEKQKAVVASSNKTGAQKKLLTDTLSKAENVGILAREVESMNQQLPIYKKLLDEKKITEQEYNDFLTQLYEKQQALSQAATDAQKKDMLSLSDTIKGVISKLFGTTDEMTSVIFNALAGAFDLAKSAMNNFFDAEQNRIQQSKEAALERLDLEKKRVLSIAQSKAEEERIEKQYDLKKKQIEKDAANRLKALKKKEARLLLVSELAAIAAAAASNPLNGVTFGAAGVAQYAVQAALALGRYAIRVGEINNTQFRYGGSADVPTRGGRFGGNSHEQGGTPFIYKGRTFEAEANELAVIRTRNAAPGNYTISGNHTQIASALNELGGGIRFAPGAKVSRFEYGGGLGESLQPPVFVPTIYNTAVSSSGGQGDALLVLMEQTKAIQAINGRIDRIEVVQVTGTVTAAQQKQVKQISVGTL